MNRILLKEIAISQTGPFGSQLHEKDYVETGTPIVTVEHLGETGFTHQNLPFVSDLDKERLSKYLLREGDIVFSRVGSVDRSTYVSMREDGWLFSGRCIRVRINKNKAHPKFISFYFRQRAFKAMMLNVSVGATMPSLNTSLMDNIPLNIPELKEQEKIAAALSALDDKIELNKKINAELEKMIKTLYDYWFVQFDFPDAKNKPYKSSGGKMVYNEVLKREVPNGWEHELINDLGTIVGGGTPSRSVEEYFTNSGIAWITPKDLSLNYGNKFIAKGDSDITEKGFMAASLNLLPAKSILMSSRAPVGYLAVNTVDCTTNQGFKSIVCNKAYSHEYVYYLLKDYMPTIEANATGSTFKEISAAVFKSIKIIKPKYEIVEKFIKRVKAIFDKQDNLERQNQQLASLRDWLLPMLMNGQAKVVGSDDQSEEPENVVSTLEPDYQKGS